MQSCIFRTRGFDGGMFQYIALSKDKSWQPGPYPGVELLILHKHETTGGVTVLRKFKAGVTIPAHIHAHAKIRLHTFRGVGGIWRYLYERHVLFCAEGRATWTARCQNRSHQSDPVRRAVDRGVNGLLIGAKRRGFPRRPFCSTSIQCSAAIHYETFQGDYF